MSLYYSADIISLILVILFGVLIDGDIVLLGSSHRISPIHSTIPWIMLIIILFVLGIPYFWTPIAALLHLFLDSLDWGIYAFYPLSKKIYGPKILSKRSTLDPQKDPVEKFVKQYLSSSFLYAEIFLMIVTIITFTLL